MPYRCFCSQAVEQIANPQRPSSSPAYFTHRQTRPRPTGSCQKCVRSRAMAPLQSIPLAAVYLLSGGLCPSTKPHQWRVVRSGLALSGCFWPPHVDARVPDPTYSTSPPHASSGRYSILSKSCPIFCRYQAPISQVLFSDSAAKD